MSYLVHHGYCSTAEAFAKTCGQAVAEDLVSMQNRQSKYTIFFVLLCVMGNNYSSLRLNSFLSQRNPAAGLGWTNPGSRRRNKETLPNPFRFKS